MPLLLFALVVVIVVALVCWVINLLPFPTTAPPYIKQILMAVIVLVGVIVIVARIPGVAW